MLQPTVVEAQPPQAFCQQRDTLRYPYQPPTPPYARPCNNVQSFRPIVGQFADGRELRDINNPQHTDVDTTFFFFLYEVKIRPCC